MTREALTANILRVAEKLVEALYEDANPSGLVELEDDDGKVLAEIAITIYDPEFHVEIEEDEWIDRPGEDDE